MPSKNKSSRLQRGAPSKTPTPATLLSHTSNSSANRETDMPSAQSLLSPPATITPPSSPSMDITFMVPPTVQPTSVGNPTTISADDIISKDIVAMADMFAAMKNTLNIMTNAFDRLEIQTETFASLSLDIKAAEQLNQVRKALDDQIARQRREIEALSVTLETKIKEAVREKIRAELYDMVKTSIGDKVDERVKNALSLQIPPDLDQQLTENRRQILENKTYLCNLKARQCNATSSLLSRAAQLCPLLRPSTTLEAVSSELFPRDLKTLFKLTAGQARTLVQQYELDNGESSSNGKSEEACYIEDMNRFMTYIGVPFSMTGKSIFLIKEY